MKNKLMLAALLAVCAPAAIFAMKGQDNLEEPVSKSSEKKCYVKCFCTKARSGLNNGVNYIQGTRVFQFATKTKTRKVVTGALLVGAAAVVAKQALAKKQEKPESQN